MNIHTFGEAAEMSAFAGNLVRAALGARPDLVLALPTGRTMLPLYRELRERHRQGSLDLSRARAFNLDELVLPREHAASFHTYMRSQAWEAIGLDPRRCDIPDPAAAPLDAECARYEQAIAAAGGFDLAILGIGDDGHVAYNLPGPPVETTHVVELPDDLAASLRVPATWRPLRAVTVGLGPLRRSRRLLMLATDASKRAAIQALVHGPEDDRWPCSLLRRHPDFELLITGELAEGAA